ncbi:MAG: helix-turn-helix transcriptional regulator [Desertifilum sp.]|nr:helix-turn-helix transcriptional regulator [Desertifilum sp.]
MSTTPLRLARELSGLTQKELAQRCGIPIATYQNWEYGKTKARPTYPQVKSLARELGITEDEVASLLGQEIDED